MKKCCIFTIFIISTSMTLLFGQSTTASGASNVMNPAISANGLFLGVAHNPISDEETNGFKIQEMELQFTSIVDPFFKADVVMALHPPHDEDHHGMSIDIEEGYLMFQSLPRGFGLRTGKFLLPFGKHNSLHTHQTPFVNAPIGVEDIFGHHAAADVGFELSYSIPLPWYSEILGILIDGDANELFDKESNQPATGGRFSNLWDISDNSTIEFGSSVLYGPKDENSIITLYGADFTFKWKDIRKVYGKAFTWQNEFLSYANGDHAGFYSIIQYKFTRRWWTSAGFSQAIEEKTSEYKTQIAFVPSEFSAVRLELVYTDFENGDANIAVYLQMNFTIGSHPAHKY